jgi:hypothetical protein
MEALVPVIACAAGALLYGLTDGKPAELGRLTYHGGIIALMFAFASKAVHLF